MIRYADTSALVPLYLPERYSAAAMAAVSAVAAVPFTAFHRLELASVFASQMGRGNITPSRWEAVRLLVVQDQAAGRLRRVHLDWEPILESAAALAEVHTPQTLARSLDLLHLAAALRLGCRAFVSGDDRQLAVARALGLTAIDIKQA